MKDRKISLCITTYNRPELTLQSFKNALNDERISEIVIYDDGSTLENRSKLCGSYLFEKDNKVKLYFGEQNEGMSLAKKKAIELAENEWCLILDSDNEIISLSTIDAIYEDMVWEDYVIYCPSYAKPHFDYTMYEDHYIDSEDIKIYLQNNKFLKLLNTCNYFVNKKKYLEVYQYDKEIKGADTIWFAYNWLKTGNGFYVVPGMHYSHKVWEGSGWKENLQENRKKAKEIEMLIREL